MRQVKDWDQYFLDIAVEVATRSKDPNTQVGAVIVDTLNGIVSTGYNGFAPGVKETEAFWQRPHKYDRVIHAEMNAICQAAKTGKATNNCTLYITHFPCIHCAKIIIAAGIKRVIAIKYIDGWDESHGKSVQLFNEGRVVWKVGDKKSDPFYWPVGYKE